MRKAVLSAIAVALLGTVPTLAHDDTDDGPAGTHQSSALMMMTIGFGTVGVVGRHRRRTS